jgi:antitoxin component of MazEF toxin-antitoxin module
MTHAWPLPLDHQRAEVFLTRVASLTPAEWGLLDAAAARLKGGGLLTRWTRARRVGAAMGYDPWIRAITTPAAFMGAALLDAGFAVRRVYHTGGSIGDAKSVRQRVEDALRQYERMTQQQTERSRPTTTGFDATRVHAHFERLTAVAKEQPGHLLGDAADCLFAALYGVLMRPNLMADAFDELYRPVESTIPAASLNALP